MRTVGPGEEERPTGEGFGSPVRIGRVNGRVDGMISVLPRGFLLIMRVFLLTGGTDSSASAHSGISRLGFRSSLDDSELFVTVFVLTGIFEKLIISRGDVRPP